MCRVVALEVPHSRHFKLISLLVKRIVYTGLVRISSSWIAHMYRSACEKNDIFFSHKCVALSLTWLLSLRAQNRVTMLCLFYPSLKMVGCLSGLVQ